MRREEAGVHSGDSYAVYPGVNLFPTEVERIVEYTTRIALELKVIGLVIPLRASESEETEGLDISQHGEEAYSMTGGTSPMLSHGSAASSSAYQAPVTAR